MIAACPPWLASTLSRAVRSCKPSTYHSIRTTRLTSRRDRANFYTSRPTGQETYQQRYGPAATPPLPPPPKPSEAQESHLDKERKVEPASPVAKEETEPKERPASKSGDEQPKVREPQIGQEETSYAAQAKDGKPLQNKELDMILSIPSPSEIKGESQKHPHLEASPYEHHFDTYSLVQQLAKGGFSQRQSVTLMKAVRSMLAINLDIAKEGLVSKSDTENETYLFRAACSELRTTLQAARQSEAQRQRSQRAQQQHEYDLLNQRFTQDMLSMRDDLKGMFNDRKMSLQEEKRKIDGKISELNYEITVLLNSDSKSEVEGLRWVLTRRAALAIAAAAIMVLSALNLSSIKTREREEIEKKKAAAKKVQDDRAEARYTTPSRAQGTQTDSASQANYEESLG